MPLGTLGHKVATISLSISLGTVGWDFESTLLPLEELQVLMNHALVTLSADGTDPTLIHHIHLRQRPKRTST